VIGVPALLLAVVSVCLENKLTRAGTSIGGALLVQQGMTQILQATEPNKAPMFQR